MAGTSFEDRLTEQLQRRAEAGLLRTPRTVEYLGGHRARVEGRECVVFCSNDYLGLGAKSLESERAGGTAGSTASRLISGGSPEHAQLEAGLAAWLGHASSLLFSSGYAANVGALSSLLTPEDTVFSDALNHASLIDGMRLSKARVVIVPHNDPDALSRLIRETQPTRGWVVVESLFSMDGDIARLSRMESIARESSLHLFVDEAHAIGVLGPSGRGVCAELGIRADVMVATLGKSLGSTGAFVCGSHALTQWLFNTARSQVFSTALSPQSVRSAIRSLETIQSGELRSLLEENIAYLRHQLIRAGIEARGDARSPIVPIVLGSPERAVECSARLLERGIFVQAIRPPTVPNGTSRLRITVTAAHTRDEMDALVEGLKVVLG